MPPEQYQLWMQRVRACTTPAQVRALLDELGLAGLDATDMEAIAEAAMSHEDAMMQ